MILAYPRASKAAPLLNGENVWKKFLMNHVENNVAIAVFDQKSVQ